MDTFENENNQEDIEDEEQESIVDATNKGIYSNERGTVHVLKKCFQTWQEIADTHAHNTLKM
jgi:hypothetical protein